MYVRDGFMDLDRMLVRHFGVMRQMLEDVGYKVDIATPRDETLATDTFALTQMVRNDLPRFAGRDRTLTATSGSGAGTRSCIASQPPTY